MNRTQLPIDAHKDNILNAVANNSVVIIRAEAGAGKTTRVSQILLNAGYHVICTQPRIISARNAATFVAQEVGVELGGLVGYRTGEDKDFDSKDTRCLFVTDGLLLVRQLLGHGQFNSEVTVLVIDEVHEQNINMEVLMAWCKYAQAQGRQFKLVCMSATMEVEEFSAYFNNAPVIEVTGRSYPLQMMPRGVSMEADTLMCLERGQNVLVFMPGKREVDDFVETVQARAPDCVVLPLYGELTREEQQKCFQSYRRPLCIVSTNIAQTGLTIPGIDVVVDSGLERRIELVDGVEGLYLLPISLADGAQRAGRAARTKPGMAIDHCPAPREERLAYPVPQILRSHLNQTVLRLAEAGIDAELFEFLHQPAQSDIHAAKHSLQILGCMDGAGHVTELGHRVARIPLDVAWACSVVKAEEYDEVDNVLRLHAIAQQGGITDRTTPLS